MKPRKFLFYILLILTAISCNIFEDKDEKKNEEKQKTDVEIVYEILSLNEIPLSEPLPENGGFVQDEKLTIAFNDSGRCLYFAVNSTFQPTSTEPFLNVDTIPPSIGQLTEMTYFGIIQSKASWIDTVRHSITKLPDEIGNLKKMREIVLVGTMIKELPESVFELTEMTDLWLRANEIEYLPDELGNLTNLKYFDIKASKIKFLPETFGNLQKLEKFFSTSSDLVTLPNSFIELKNLKEIEISGIPKEHFASGGKGRALKYLPNNIGELYVDSDIGEFSIGILDNNFPDLDYTWKPYSLNIYSMNDEHWDIPKGMKSINTTRRINFHEFRLDSVTVVGRENLFLNNKVRFYGTRVKIYTDEEGHLDESLIPEGYIGLFGIQLY